MKQLFIIMLAAVLVIGLTACAAENGQAQNDNTGSEASLTYKSWEDVPLNTYNEETITVDYNGQKIWGAAYIPEKDLDKYPLVICSHGLGGDYTSCMLLSDL